jgi:hypothetical protein
MPFCIEEAQPVVRGLFIGCQTGRRRVAGPEDVRRECFCNVGWGCARHIGVNPEELGRCLCPHHIQDLRTPIAALRHEPRIAQAPDQCDPGTRDVVPTGSRQSPREPVAGHRRNHHTERVLRVTAMCRRIAERADNIQHLDDRTRRADQRQRLLVRRAHMDEVDVEAVDLVMN